VPSREDVILVRYINEQADQPFHRRVGQLGEAFRWLEAGLFRKYLLQHRQGRG